MKITNIQQLIALIAYPLFVATFFLRESKWSRALGWELVVVGIVYLVLVYLNSTLIIDDRTFKALGWSLVGATVAVAAILTVFRGSEL